MEMKFKIEQNNGKEHVSAGAEPGEKAAKGGNGMLVTEDLCVGCPPEVGCLGWGCPMRNVDVYVCDRCGSERFVEPGVGRRGEDLCCDCLRKEKEEESGAPYEP